MSFCYGFSWEKRLAILLAIYEKTKTKKNIQSSDHCKIFKNKDILFLNTISAAGYDSTNNTLKNVPQES